MYLKFAWRNLWRNKRRTLITTSSVFFAVIFAIFIMGLKEGMYERMIDNMVGGYMGYIQVHKSGYWEDKTLENSLIYSDSLHKALVDTDPVEGVVPRLESFALTSSDTLAKAAIILGTDPEAEKQMTTLHERVTKGEYFKKNDASVLVGEGLADYLRLDVGDTLIILGQGFHGVSAAAKYPVQGILKLPAPELNKQTVFLPIKEAQWLFSSDNRASSLILLIDDVKNMDATLHTLEAALGNDYEIMSWQEMVPEVDKMIKSDRVEGYIFMGILYVIIAFGIYGTLLMMVAERKHEFGVLVGIGMKRIKLAFIVWLEITLIGLLGAGAGMIAGYPVLAWFHYNPIPMGGDLTEMMEEYGFEAVLQSSMDPAILVQQGVIVLLMTTVLSLYPFFKLLTIDALVAMRS